MVETRPPIFVLALHPRSGTHFLGDLLCAHPSVGHSPVPEDYIGARADLLADYADRLVEKWEPYFDRGRLSREDHAADQLLRRFGQALLAFAGLPDPTRHTLFQTPALQDLFTLQRLFPAGHMLILLRDPRSIAESWVRSTFEQGASIETVAQRWAQSVRRLEGWLDPATGTLDRSRVHFVRFEQLAQDPAREYPEILDALGLSRHAEAVAYAADPPVIGSSFGSGEGADDRRRTRPDFTPTPRPRSFDPTCRWAHWSRDTHRRFNRICGPTMDRWGYTRVFN